MSQLPKILFYGHLELGGVKIPCANLDNGMRVISERGVAAALGSRGGAHWRRKKLQDGGGADLPSYLSAPQLKPFIGSELMAALTSKIECEGTKGLWVEADLLRGICDVWIRAKMERKLLKPQQKIADQAYIVLNGFALVGIAALVDAATGFEKTRDRYALQQLLDKYLLKELAAWAKRFPDEFYKQIFRLRGWQWNGMKINRPSVVGRYTNDLVYERLAPNILEELKKRMPLTEAGNRKGKLQQLLTEEVGHPALQAHLQGLMALQRAAPERGWAQFVRSVERAYPKLNVTIPLALDD